MTGPLGEQGTSQFGLAENGAQKRVVDAPAPTTPPPCSPSGSDTMLRGRGVTGSTPASQAGGAGSNPADRSRPRNSFAANARAFKAREREATDKQLRRIICARCGMESPALDGVTARAWWTHHTCLPDEQDATVIPFPKQAA